MLFGAGKLVDELSPFQIPCVIAFLWRSGTRAKPWSLIGAGGWEGDSQLCTGPPRMLGSRDGGVPPTHMDIFIPELPGNLRGSMYLSGLLKGGWLLE